VDKNFGQPCCSSRTDLAINPLAEIYDTRPDNEPPTLITKAVLRGIERECRNVIRVRRITNEAAGSVSIQTYHEKEREVVCVPEGLETLIAYLVVGGCVHQKHHE
jgi:hypothetical protein